MTETDSPSIEPDACDQATIAFTAIVAVFTLALFAGAVWLYFGMADEFAGAIAEQLGD